MPLTARPPVNAPWARFAGPQSLRSWVSLSLTFLLLPAALCLGEFGSNLPPTYQVVGWMLLAVALVVLLRRGLRQLFGPVLFYDLVTLTRRSRFFVVRGLYALALLVILFWVYDGFSKELAARKAGAWTFYTPSSTRAVRLPPSGPTGDDMARFAQMFFARFMVAQILVVVILTPAYTAGAVAEEKDRGTLEFLLATDLRDREIVLSKLASRLANLTLLLLAGLPVLSLTQLWGGIDPLLVLATFAGTGLTMLSVAALSILSSVYARKPRDAIVLTYLVTLGYLGLSFLSREVLQARWLANQQVLPSLALFTLKDVGDAFNAGNPYMAFAHLSEELQKNTPLSTILPPLLRDYGLFHGLVALVCSAWAVWRLRAVAIRQGLGRARQRGRRLRYWRRPRLGRHPMLWKEVFTEAGLSLSWFGRAIIALIILASFLPALWILANLVWWDPSARAYDSSFAFGYSGLGSRLGEAFNRWVRLVGTLVACLTLAGVAVRASSAISGERDRQTLDGLLTSALDSRSILLAKWLGSILSVRWAGVWLCLIWAVGLATGGLDRTTMPWLVLAWVVYAAFLASLGLWFSSRSQTTLRATLSTLVATAVVWFGHWLIWILFPSQPGGFNQTDWVRQFAMFGLTPPAALSFLAFSKDFHPLDLAMAGDSPLSAFVSLLAGLFLWGGAGLVLWSVSLTSFQRLANRRRRRPPPQAGRHWVLPPAS